MEFLHWGEALWCEMVYLQVQSRHCSRREECTRDDLKTISSQEKMKVSSPTWHVLPLTKSTKQGKISKMTNGPINLGSDKST
jgi:hypothetical protein